jgi:hypothetical protein
VIKLIENPLISKVDSKIINASNTIIEDDKNKILELKYRNRVLLEEVNKLTNELEDLNEKINIIKYVLKR